jgi:hypothetical protein
MAGGVILPYGSTATAADVGSMDPARARRRTLALAGLLVAAACVAAVGLIAPAPGTDALEVRLTRRARARRSARAGRDRGGWEVWLSACVAFAQMPRVVFVRTTQAWGEPRATRAHFV